MKFPYKGALTYVSNRYMPLKRIKTNRYITLSQYVKF